LQDRLGVLPYKNTAARQKKMIDGLRKPGLPERRANFRCWLKADMASPENEVRFAPKSGRD
jgi:hypothetical protein